MKTVRYLTEENEELYDFETMRILCGTTKSKLQRELKRLNLEQSIKYKNQFLYNQKSFFTILETLLCERLERGDYGL